jgi:hypothetical protein
MILSKMALLLQVECSKTSLEYALRTWGVLRNIKKGSLEAERLKSRISELFTSNYNVHPCVAENPTCRKK